MASIKATSSQATSTSPFHTYRLLLFHGFPSSFTRKSFSFYFLHSLHTPLMALFHPFLCHNSLSFSIISPSFKASLTTKFLFPLPPSSYPLKPLPTKKNKKLFVFSAVADNIKAVSSFDQKEDDDHKILLGPTTEEERRGERVVADYDWTEEWYPLYLTKDVPDDAPLGLTVFDKQLVLYSDDSGKLRCFEDRCPHR